MSPVAKICSGDYRGIFWATSGMQVPPYHPGTKFSQHRCTVESIDHSVKLFYSAPKSWPESWQT